MESKYNYPSGFFKFNVFAIKIAGLWVPDKSEPYRKRLLYKAYMWFAIIYCQIYLSPAEISQLYKTRKSAIALLEHLGMILTHTLGTMKVINYLTKRERIIRLLQMLEDDEFKYEDCGDYMPGAMVASAFALATFMDRLFMSTANLVPGSNYIMPAYRFMMTSNEEYATGNATCGMPYFTWTPFPTNSKVLCGLGIINQAIPTFLYSLQITAHDTLFINVLTCAKAHLFTLQGAFENIRIRCLQKLNLPQDYETFNDDDNPELEQEMYDAMTKSTKHLQTITYICDEVESIFTYATLGQTMATLTVLVACLYLVSSVPLLSGTFAAQGVYLGAIILQLGFYAWFGNEITLASILMPDSIYGSDWITTSLRFKKAMIMNMTRLKIPIQMTVGKFTPLTLTTLVQIVRGSYSYYAVLKKTQ